MRRTDQEQAFKYLLGDLSDAQRDAIEERFFTDEDFSRLMDDAENDLIDEYARGALPEREAQFFSRHFLVSERRKEKVRTAQILQNRLFAEAKKVNAVSITAEQPSFWTSLQGFFRAPQIAFATLALLLLVFGGWFGLRNRNSTETAQVEESPAPPTANQPASSAPDRTKVDPAINKNLDRNQSTSADKNAAANPRKINEKPANEAKPNSSAMPTTVASLLLLPATRSSSQNRTLNLRANVAAVNLQIANDREEDVDEFRVELRSIDGALIAAQNFRNADYKRKNFNLRIPAAKLAAADYQVTLKGADAGAEFQNLNYFYFSIEKK